MVIHLQPDGSMAGTHTLRETTSVSKTSQLLGRPFVVLALAIIMICGCVSQTTKNHQEYSSVNGSFALWIREYDDNVILGSHCFVLYSGNLIDCVVDSQTSVVMLRDKSEHEQPYYRMLLASEYRYCVAALSVRYTPDTIEILTNDTSLFYETANVVLTRRDQDK
jgi:hypothetical protein